MRSGRAVTTGRGGLRLLVWVAASFLTLVTAQDCGTRDKSLEEREEMASVVLSGTVRRIISHASPDLHSHDLHKGEVEVKRVLKGEEVVQEVATVVLGSVRQHKMVVVHGFGDPQICDSHVRLADTKIFLLSRGPNGELRLNSSTLPITLYNLQRAEAAIRDVPFTEEEEGPKRSPCETFFCAFGAVCMVELATTRPYCQCHMPCPSVFAPVCGSDNVTYASQCLLEKAACVHQKRVKVAMPGVCGKRDPCLGKICNFGATCKPSLDGSEARCECPSHCYRYGDNVGSKPVCGSDGNDYPNLCELKKAACKQLLDIRVKYYGKCDPCVNVSCVPPQVCLVDSHREPKCDCKLNCSNELAHVCGSDGRTYSNKCYLEREACKQQKSLTVFYNGECTSANNPCDKVKCRPMEECSVDRNGLAACKCPFYCEPVVRYVCGNDSRTYDSECVLRKKTCEANGPYVVVAYNNQCAHDAPCQNFHCENNAVCVARNGKPECVCGQCTEEYAPICGTNGITYESECKLQQENCEQKTSVKVKDKGPCHGCSTIKCEFFGVCEMSGDTPMCVCPTKAACRKVDLPVCGSDGRTYNNECEMKVESCRRREIIGIVSTGSCEKCRGVVCHYGARCENGVCVCPITCTTVREAVCGSDGKTYINKCEMQKSACALSENIEVAQDGECEGDVTFSGSGSGDFNNTEDDCDEKLCSRYGGQCTVNADGSFKCGCNFVCNAVRSPVCGSDGRTFGNICELKKEECEKQKEIVEVSMEDCNEFDIDSVDACDGAAPLVNTLTGKDYDCMPGKDMCPPGSYCHATPAFAKCCKEDVHESYSCSDTPFGCCKDNTTASLGPHYAGCPEYCQCNAIGSYSRACEPGTGQCTCKSFVRGLKCDHCDIGYWGLHKIMDNGNSGCIACNCNRLGSERDDCDQMTGRCMCKPLVSGMKCDRCSNGQSLGPRGCDDPSFSEWNKPTSCDELECRNGAICHLRQDNTPECVCDLSCDNSANSQDIVCGTDNQNYGSECQLKMFACRFNSDITVAHRGPCKALPPPPPVRTTTSLPSTSRARKTTRHIDGEVPDDNGTPRSGGTHKPDLNDNVGGDSCKGSYIDGLCLDNRNCCSNHSQCKLGLCHCLPNYVPSVDNRKCIEVKKENQPIVTLPPEKDACADNPCYAGGKCELDDLLGFRCTCPLGRSGPLCNKQAEFKIPSFNGRSFLELPQIQDVDNDLSIEVVFQTLNKDGIVLFNAQNPNGTGDFVSLAVQDGFIEFRFDLGAGEAALRSRTIVEPGRSHRVVARRMKASGILIVDNDPDVTGNSPSTHTSLNLHDPLYVGFIPRVSPEVYERVGVDLGLVGCIHLLKAGNKNNMRTYNMDFTSYNNDILNGSDISECGSNPCKSMPCRNGGTCLLLDVEMFDCKCPEGYRGVLCEELVDACASQPCQYGATCHKAANPQGFLCRCTEGREGTRCERESMPQLFVPQFTGSSYMEIPLDAAALSKSMTIEVWFRPLQPNGVLFFATQFVGGSGDFISLNLNKKHLEFKFFLGSGVATLESKKMLHLDKWYKVEVRRDGQKGQMTINSHDPITATAAGTLTELNLDQSLFIGGYSNIKDVPRDSGINVGFTGAIQRVIINGQTVDNLMGAAKRMGNITEYNGPPCNVNPCMNGGMCVPMLNNAECRCPYNYMGQNCEKRADHVDKNQPVKFDGNTFLNYPSEVKKRQPAQRSNEIVIRFKTTEQNGLLLFQNKGDSVKLDYLALAVVKGRVEFSYNLGKQSEDSLHILRSNVDVTDNQWHDVKATRNLRDGSLVVDNEVPVTKQSKDGSTQLDSDGELWVGGRSNLPWGLPPTYYQGFSGCIQEIKINGQELHLVDHRNGHSSTIAFCS